MGNFLVARGKYQWLIQNGTLFLTNIIIMIRRRIMRIIKSDWFNDINIDNVYQINLFNQRVVCDKLVSLTSVD